MSDPTPPDEAPTDDALAHSARLQALIREQIAAAGGAIPFWRFMELALYAPGLGYYSAGATKFGGAGDFVTAPELGPLFAECVAGALAPALRQLGPQARFLEIGAGSGRFAGDAIAQLLELEAMPARYAILEPSADLRERQRARQADRAADGRQCASAAAATCRRDRGRIVAETIIRISVVEQMRMRQRVVQIDHLDRDQLRDRVATRFARIPVTRGFAEAVVADALEQRFAIGGVAVARHRRDPDRPGHAAHTYRGRTLALEQCADGCEDAARDVGSTHIYIVNWA